MQDEQLIEALVANLDGSFERFVLAYQNRIYGFALRLCSNPADAEEIAQDSFVRAYMALAGYPAARVRALVLRPWLFQIALNVLRNRVRGRRPRITSLDEPECSTLQQPGDGDGCPQSALDRSEQQAEIAAALARLPLRYRAAVVLRHVEGFAYADIARMLEQPAGTVKANVHRGVLLLRAALADERQ